MGGIRSIIAALLFMTEDIEMNNFNWKMLLLFISNVFSAAFLTILVDDITLTTMLQRVFIFLYFFIILNIFIITASIKLKKRNWKVLIVSGIVAIFLIGIFGFHSFYKTADIKIMPIGKENTEAKGEEVWIKNIIIDGKSYDEENYHNMDGWYFDNSSGYLVSYNEEITESMNINVTYRNEIQLVFIGHQWSGGVNVIFNNKTYFYDLYSSEGVDIEKTFTDIEGKSFICLQNIFVIFGSWILFTELVYIFLSWGAVKRREVLHLYLLSVTAVWLDGLCALTTYVVIILLGMLLYYLTLDDIYKTIRKYRKHFIPIVFIALYITFCLFGRQTFLYEGNHNIAVIFSFIACLCIIFEIFTLLEKVTGISKKESESVSSLAELKKSDKLFLLFKNIVITIILTSASILILDDYIIKEYQDSMITVKALAQNGELNNGNEILLDSIHVDGKSVEMQEYIFSLEGGWKKFGENSLIYNQSNEISELKLSFPAAKKIELYFYNYSVAGKVLIKDGTKEVIIDFSSSDTSYSNNFYIYQVESNIIPTNYSGLYILYTILTFSIIFCIITAQDFFAYKKAGKRLKMKQKYVYWICWLIIFGGLNIICYAYFPGNWTWDNLFQWAQATNMVELSDGHPVIMTLFLKLLLSIYKHPYMLEESMILLAATTFATIYTYLFENGLNKKISYALSILTAISPAIIIMTVTILKDSFHMCFMVLTVFYIYVLLKTPQYFKRPYYFIGLILSLFFVNQLRHEAILFFIVSSLVIIVCSLIKKKFFIIGAVMIAIICSYSFDNYKEGLLKNESDSEGIIVTVLLHDMSRVLYDNSNLTNETSKLMQKYLPLEKWKELYNPYDRDTLGFNSEYKAALEKNSEVDLFGILRCYLQELVKNPASILRARLDAVDGMWYVGDNKESVMFYGIDGIMTFYCVGPKELGFHADENGSYITNNWMSKMVKPIIEYIEKNHFLNVLFLNVGLSIVMCFIMLQYLWRENKKLIIIFIPIIVRICTMLLISGWQHFRYYYSIRLMIVFALIFSIFDIACKGRGKQ